MTLLSNALLSYFYIFFRTFLELRVLGIQICLLIREAPLLGIQFCTFFVLAFLHVTRTYYYYYYHYYYYYNSTVCRDAVSYARMVMHQ